MGGRAPGVVIEMGSLEHSSNHQNCINPTNKIPEYAREYKNEYLFIRGINKEIKYFIDNIERSTTDLFKSHKVDRIKYFMKRFLRGQEKGKLKDISEFEIDEDDVENIIWMAKKLNYFKLIYEYVPRPGIDNIYYDVKLFFSKLKIKYKERKERKECKFYFFNDDDDDVDDDYFDVGDDDDDDD